MNAQALALRPVSTTEASIRQRIGTGLSLPFQLNRQKGQLALRLAPMPGQSVDEGHLECASGPLRLTNTEALLGLLSSCPALLQPSDSSEDHQWYWQLYNHYLSPELQHLFGTLQPLDQTNEQGLDCLLEARINGLRVCSRLSAPPATLLDLLDRGQWQQKPVGKTWPWPVNIPLLLGHLALTYKQLKGLRPGDVLLPDHPLFTPDGHGILQLGSCRLNLVQESANALCFTLTELEQDTMNATIDHFAASDSDNPILLDDIHLQEHEEFAETTADGSDDLERFNDLALALTLRAGNLSLSLGQLRSLSVGSVLTFNGCAPGNAMLFHGERALAHGELVDVEGRLGLQITRMEALR
ncbi:type III secretion system cytoplasmic ring protein SctQ [Pseudomonas capsici]|uniref:type III secretion system cytoplasmic ring protein SctQ n=1 Tax=Pseudomonas capsici TaxID=2810614 RepID=UPI0021F14F72|nr:type III secretion system cytoplasmic ring protein SctQ [Pseudomonas capsici]MCV4264847.1 type III secretion system cytoplasmic ring protein SctQ [Pseudomonas capsici]